jgi:4-amino-4-deoxy-L-arabinose transferase-like glycosyltransferase
MQPRWLTNQKMIAILLLFVGFLLFFYKVGDRDLWAPDEDEYAQMSREMIRYNNWAYPTVNGEPWAVKPALYNWLTGLISLPYGDVDEFRARIFSALAALGTFLLVFYLGQRMFSTMAGLLAASVLGTSILFLQYARWAQTNMLSTFFATLAIYCFYRGYTDPPKRSPSYLMMYVAVALGVLTMGPVNLIMPGLVVFIYLVVAKDLRHIMALKIVWGVLIVSILAAPWYVMVSLGDGYASELLVKTNWTRFFNAWTHKRPFYYYFIGLPWAFLPWSLFLPGAVHLAFSKRSQAHRRALQFLLVWVFSLLIFFSIAQTKRHQYILIIYPALALLVGYLGEMAIRHWPSSYYRKAVAIPAFILAVLLALAALALPIGAGVYLKSWLGAILGVSVIMGTCAVLLGVAWRRRQVKRMLFLPALMVLLLTVYSVHILIPKMEFYKSPRPFCEEVKAHLEKGAQWAMYRFYRAAYVYYTDSFAKVLEDDEALQAYLAQPTLALVVMKESHYNMIKNTLEGKAFLVTRRQIGHRPMVLLANQQIRPQPEA